LEASEFFTNFESLPNSTKLSSCFTLFFQQTFSDNGALSSRRWAPYSLLSGCAQRPRFIRLFGTRWWYQKIPASSNQVSESIFVFVLSIANFLNHRSPWFFFLLFLRAAAASVSANDDDKENKKNASSKVVVQSRRQANR
jgi:hypothetical protein